MAILTQVERDTINAAFQIILENTPLGASWQPSLQNFHGNPGASVTYFTSRGQQFSSAPGNTFADRIDSCIALQADEDADQDAAKQRRIDALRKQLASLTGEQVAA